MQCPKCAHDMEKMSYKDIEVDRCTLCKGLWFDALEHEALKATPGSEAIDSGDPEVGKLFNEEERVKCPVCHVPMLKMVDAEQPHIWYESCTVCYGVFFDAGEFTDYKHHTFMDFLRGLRTRERE